MRAGIPVTSLIAAALAFAATLAEAAPRWSRVGSTAIDLGLAGVAGGPVAETAFSLDGSILSVRTPAGRVWRTSDDGASWTSFTADLDTPDPFSRPPVFDPSAAPPDDDKTALVVQHPFRGGERFALGLHLHRSADGGETWVNLTRDELGSVIGPWQSSVAFSPTSPDTLVVGNSLGVWKSADNGLTWIGLNQSLPNFPAGKLLHPPMSDRFLGLYVEGFGELETTGRAGAVWREALQGIEGFTAARLARLPAEDRLRTAPFPLRTPEGILVSHRVWIAGIPVTGDLTACAAQVCSDPARHYISAFASAGDGATLYLGTSDGRIRTSENGGLTWRRSAVGLPDSGAVTALFAHPDQAASALAVFDGETGARVFRTTNGGAFWDDLTTDLPEGGVFGLAADAATGAVYLAAEAGVFYTIADLTSPAAPTAWQSAGDLPAAATDVLLDTVAGRLYAVVEGYGVYSVRAPAVSDALRVLNAADLTQRAAAPGGLLTILGEGLERAGVAGVAAPVLFSDGTETQIQVPYHVTGKALSLRLTTGSGTREMGFPLAEVSPAIFVDQGSPLVLDAGTGTLLNAAHPAVAGSRILILATGLGAVKPDWPTGVPAPAEDPPETVEAVRVYLNGISLRVFSSTLAAGYVGTYLVDAEMPSVLTAGTGELVLEAAGVTGNRVRIYTEP